MHERLERQAPVYLVTIELAGVYLVPCHNSVVLVQRHSWRLLQESEGKSIVLEVEAEVVAMEDPS